MAAGETLREAVRMSYGAVAHVAIMVFCVVMPNGSFVRCPQEGNLISIGPGMYPSNRTLDGGGRSILVLGSCEFMHNGTLSGLNFYVASADWMILQIWRPVSMDAVSMMLVYERMIEPNTSIDDITQLRFDEEELHVLEGDRIGFTKLNHTFPIPYVFNPQMSADLWYNRVPGDVALPNISDVITFEEMGFPYHFSVTVTFKAQVSRNPPAVLRPTNHKTTNFNDVVKPSQAKGKGQHELMLGDAPAPDTSSSGHKYKGVNLVIKHNKPDKAAGAEAGEEDATSTQDKVSAVQETLNAGDVIEVVSQSASSSSPHGPPGAAEVSPGATSGVQDVGPTSSNLLNTTSLPPQLTEEGTSSHQGARGEEVSTEHSQLSSSTNNEHLVHRDAPTQRPPGLADTQQQATLSTTGPKFIFDTGMQTFSNHMGTGDTPSEPMEEEQEEDGAETTVASSLDATSALYDTSDITSEDDLEVTSDSSIDNEDNATTATDSWENQSSSKTISKTKGLPNDTKE